MTHVSKRSWLKTLALGTVAAAVLVACGKKEEPKVVEAPKPEPLKIAFAYVGPVGDGGWTFAHDNARKAIEAELATRSKPRSLRTCPSRPTLNASSATWLAKAIS